MKNVYCDNYETYFYNNELSVFCYKNNRINSKGCYIPIRHLIAHNPDKKLSDETILQYFVSTLEKITYYYISNNCKGLIIKSVGYYHKPVVYVNANNDLYHGIESILITTEKTNFSSFEGLVNQLFNMFCIVYPYNTISIKTIHNNLSVRYYINMWYEYKTNK